MNPALDDASGHVCLRDFAGKRVLMLQGPVGPFFRNFARDLEKLGASVSKINFNGGDWLFYPSGSRAFKGTLEQWPAYLRNAVKNWRINAIVLYGDCRPVHEEAFKLREELGVDIYTFEEGYIRPDYVTLEKGRANWFSNLPRTPIAYLNGPAYDAGEEMPVGYSFLHLAVCGTLYHAAAAVLSPLFPHNTYHRGIGACEWWPQIRSFWRKLVYERKERGVLERLENELAGKYFLVPLQVNSDSQIRRHSEFSEGGMEAFIRHVLKSFAAHAPEDAHIVFKHHPMDRGYHDYSLFMKRAEREYGLEGRLVYVHDLNLPSLINHSRGVVVVNSTVGLSAIMHGRPVKTCGKAMYDMPGLTAQFSLDEFWRRAGESAPDGNLVRRYRAAVIARTQINGNFYRKLANTPLKCGLNWVSAARVKKNDENRIRAANA